MQFGRPGIGHRAVAPIKLQNLVPMGRFEVALKLRGDALQVMHTIPACASDDSATVCASLLVVPHASAATNYLRPSALAPSAVRYTPISLATPETTGVGRLVAPIASRTAGVQPPRRRAKNDLRRTRGCEDAPR